MTTHHSEIPLTAREPQRSTILVIDDTPDNIALMSDLLRERYRVKVATSGRRGLQVALSGSKPDLILLDVMMPDMDGYSVCRALKSETATRDIPVIFLTALSDHTDEERGLTAGAVDYITKPINPAITLARIETHLKLKAAVDLLKGKNEFLEAEVARRSQQLAAIQDVTILMLASLAETRDNETGNHIRRTQNYVRLLAERVQLHERFRHQLTPGDIDLLYKSAPLHDVGKVGIPDSILLKPGKLTTEEFEIMKTHTTLGRDAIVTAEKRLGVPVEFLRSAKEIAYSHHEKWDSTGYPEGLGGDAIPLSARLMCVVDVYDAVRSRRVYKPAMTHEQARAIILEGRGKHFDPDIADTFMGLNDEFVAIANRYSDGD